jgi:ATP-dependent RNA helicase DDX23/PRP28
MGFKDPSPIQRQAIPIGLMQRDVIGIAETGSGKTAAFVIPMLTYMLRVPEYMRERAKDHGPLALIMAPTRELVNQIESEIVKLGKYCGVRVVSVVGGQSIEDQGRQVQQGVDIMVATPGRLNECIELRYVVLNQCNYIVLDEADRMIDMGFEPQVVSVMDAMGSQLKSESEEDLIAQEMADTNTMGLKPYRTTIMFSATMPPSVEKMAKTYLRHPVIVAIGDQESVKNKRIEQRIKFLSNESKKRNELISALKVTARPIIVFCNEKRTCDTTARFIEGLGYSVSVLHGGKGQEQREYSLAQFRDGDTDVLCATDVAGRGLDIKGVLHVINYDMTMEIDRYTHRIGRTGRAGLDGIATTFITEADSKVFYELKAYLEATKSAIPSELARHAASSQKPGDFVEKKRESVQFLK